MSEIQDEQITDELEGLEQKITSIDKPKKVLAELCRHAGQVVDFCCFLKINEYFAAGWIFHSKELLPDLDIGEVKFSLDEIDGLEKSIEEDRPLFVDKLNLKCWNKLLAKRNMGDPYPLAFFPVKVGQKAPFLFIAENQEKLDAEIVGNINRWLVSVGMRLSSLILERRHQKDDTKQRLDIRPLSLKASKLMAENWASAYSESKNNIRWKKRQKRNIETSPNIDQSQMREFELSD